MTWLDNVGDDATPDTVVDYMGIYRGSPGLVASVTNNLLESRFSSLCQFMESWNAYHCQGLEHRMLVIESMDGDSETRRLSPVALVGGHQWQYTDLLNGPMDHGMAVFVVCLHQQPQCQPV